MQLIMYISQYTIVYNCDHRPLGYLVSGSFSYWWKYPHFRHLLLGIFDPAMAPIIIGKLETTWNTNFIAVFSSTELNITINLSVTEFKIISIVL